MKALSVCAAALLLGMALMVVSCTEDDDPTGGPGPGPSITADDFVGKWVAVKLSYHELYDADLDSVWDVDAQETYTIAILDTFALLEATSSTVYWYEYFPLWYGNCIIEYTGPFSLTGDTLKGTDWWDYYQASGSDIYRIVTTAAMSGDSLVLTWKEEYASATEMGSETYVTYFIPYTGDVPLASWPTTPCALPKRRAR